MQGISCVIKTNMSSEPEEKWERYVVPKLQELVKKLNPSLLLEDLRTCGLLTSEDCNTLRHDCSNEEERTRQILYDILPRRGNDAFDRFCDVLRTTEGQKHILSEVLQIKSMEESSVTCKEIEKVPQQKVSNSNKSTVEAHASSLAEVESQWESVGPCLPDLTNELRPCLLLDELRENGLLTREQYIELQNKSMSEAERSEMLVSTILPQKGNESFETFCKVLNNEEKQRHIVSKILKAQNVALLPIHSSNSATVVETIEEFKSDTHESSRKRKRVEASKALQSTSTRSKKLCVEEKVRSATFTFREKDEVLVKRWEKSVVTMCEKCFGMLEDDILFMYCFPLAGQNVSTFYGDIDNKLAVFQLNHVAPELIRKHKHRLISHIAGFMNVSEDLIYYMETIKGSTLVLFSIQLIAYLKLFSGLGVQAKCIAFYATLKQTFPELVVVKFKLGGLPTIKLTSSGVNSQNVMFKNGKLCVHARMRNEENLSR